MAWEAPGWGYGWRRRAPSTGLDLGSTWVNLVIAALAASFALLGRRLLSPTLVYDYYALGVLAGALAGFILHELAHERTAYRHGCWARFVLHPMGLALTIVSAILPVKIIAPGAVSIACPGGRGGNPLAAERIALAGVQVNIILAVLGLVASYLAPGAVSLAAYGFGAINAWVALFNLIPFPPLDGYRAARLNPVKWLAYFAIAVIIWLFYM